MTWLSDRTTRSKLLMAFAALAAVMVWVGVGGLRETSHLQAGLEGLHDDRLVPVLETAKLQAALLRVRTTVLQHVVATDAAKMQGLEAETRELEATIDGLVRRFEAFRPVAEEDRALERFKKSWSEIKEGRAQALVLSASGKKGEALVAVQSTIAQRFREGSTAIEELLELNTKAAAGLVRSSRHRYTATLWFTITLLAGGLALACLLALGLARMLARPLGEAARVLAGVAAGDFSRHLDVGTTDEVGQLATALNQAIDTMRDALRDVSTAAARAASVSAQLSETAEQLASGAQEQAAALEQTAASLEEITATVKQNADNARQADELATGSRQVAERGGQVVAAAVTAMTEINRASKRIADIITTIDEIAFQTNLLALNAAVEAARAGEQGRGFAVVAAEVRNLAQRSAAAAKEIKGLIQDSVAKVEGGSELVNRSGATLSEIIGSATRVTDIIGEIAAASREQSIGIEQVNRAVAQMDGGTQSTAAQSEELSATAQQLSGQARQLQALVSRFRLSASVTATSSASGLSSPARAMAASDAARRAPSVWPSAPPAMASGAGGAVPGDGSGSVRRPTRAGTTAADGFEEF